MHNAGFEVICGDATVVNLQERFEVVVCGEIIEHVDGGGALLRNMARHLTPGGVLVITTPNPFYSLHAIEFVCRQQRRRWNGEHVAWFCEFTLGNLLQRNGLRMSECRYFTRSRKLLLILRVLHLPCPRLMASTLVVLAVRAPESPIGGAMAGM